MTRRIDKKKLKIIVSIVIAIIVIDAVILLFNPVRSLAAAITMRPLKTQEVATDVYVIKNGVANLYLYKAGNVYIAFDGGSNNKATSKALEDLGISPGDVVAVFLTHTDYDHVAALSLFPDAEVYMAGSNKAFLEEKEGQSRSKAFLDMNRNYKTMENGKSVTISGVAVQCIFSPGHTDGSACYAVNGKYLFTGDNFRLKRGKAVLFYDVFNMDNEKQKRSLSRLAKLEGIEVVFTMHSGYTADFKTAFSEWR
jgi:glyoxylase-like metal-dependent hydrolase (beta-lactamase superfamily II)